MKVVVVGSGVVGITSAWYLCRAGHDVTVVDRRSSPAMETSFGNAGQISPGYSSPWAAPGIPLKALRWLFMEHAPLIMRDPDLAMLRWLAVMLRNCTADRYSLNKRRMVRLAEFSRDCLVELREETLISYDNLSLGSLQLFRKQSQLDDVAKDVAILKQDGVAFELLDAAGCMKREPGLANSPATIAGGLLLPNDETGDCYKFTTDLAREAGRRGVAFRNDTPVRRLVPDGRIVHVECDQATISADAVLLAAGSYSPMLARPLGISLPIYPVKGYSITATIKEPSRAPVSTVIDESYKVAITRLGDRVRVGGMAELSGYNDLLPQRRRGTLERCVDSLFPDGSDLGSATFWTGLRPMTPDGTPIIGATHIPNVFLNTGHGTLGWTMACGSGRVIADIISGRPPEIEAADLSVARYL